MCFYSTLKKGGFMQKLELSGVGKIAATGKRGMSIVFEKKSGVITIQDYRNGVRFLTGRSKADSGMAAMAAAALYNGYWNVVKNYGVQGAAVNTLMWGDDYLEIPIQDLKDRVVEVLDFGAWGDEFYRCFLNWLRS